MGYYQNVERIMKSIDIKDFFKLPPAPYMEDYSRGSRGRVGNAVGV